MNQIQSNNSHKITVSVFKDNFAARSFHVPLNWISKLGLLLGSILLFSITMTLVAVKYYRIALKTDPVRVQSLELELIDLKASLKGLESSQINSTSPQSRTSISAAPLNNAIQQNKDSQPETNTPSTSTPDETNLDRDKQQKTISTSIFSALGSPNPEAKVPDSKTQAISIQNPRFSWQGSTLQVRFALHYNKQDQGSQQGRIIVLARGPETLLTFPEQTFAPAGSPQLINYKNGEFFSVSRYREVKANFNSIQSKNSLHEIELLVLSKEGQILLYEQFPISKKSNSETEDES